MLFLSVPNYWIATIIYNPFKNTRHFYFLNFRIVLKYEHVLNEIWVFIKGLLLISQHAWIAGYDRMAKRINTSLSYTIHILLFISYRVYNRMCWIEWTNICKITGNNSTVKIQIPIIPCKSVLRRLILKRLNVNLRCLV